MTSMLFAMALMSTIFVGEAEPRFALTDIRVDGARQVSEALIIAETELEIGEAYTEHQLTLARRRPMRLPHLLRAEFYLQKGASYGTYTLVVAIEEQASVFFHYGFTAHSGDPALEADPYARPTPKEGGDLALGARGFLGTWWSWYLGTEFVQDGSKVDTVPGHPLDMGLTHRNLFGHHGFFNLHLQTRDTRSGKLYDPYLGRALVYDNTRDLAPTLNLAAPIGRSGHWLSFTLAYLSEFYLFEDSGPQLQDQVNERRWSGQLKWYRDTTDDLALPRRGTRFEMGLAGTKVSSNFTIVLTMPYDPDIVEVEHIFGQLKPRVQTLASIEHGSHVSGSYQARGLDLRAGIAHYQPLDHTWMLFSRGEYLERLSERGELIRDANRRVLAGAVGLEWDLIGLLPRRPLDDLRLQLAGDYHEQRDAFFKQKVSALELGLVWRQRWGLSRAALRYEHEKNTLPFDLTEVP